MAIEIVDFPIDSMVDLSIVFCMFTRGYMFFYHPLKWKKTWAWFELLYYRCGKSMGKPVRKVTHNGG